MHFLSYVESVYGVADCPPLFLGEASFVQRCVFVIGYRTSSGQPTTQSFSVNIMTTADDTATPLLSPDDTNDNADTTNNDAEAAEPNERLDQTNIHPPTSLSALALSMIIFFNVTGMWIYSYIFFDAMFISKSIFSWVALHLYKIRRDLWNRTSRQGCRQFLCNSWDSVDAVFLVST